VTLAAAPVGPRLPVSGGGRAIWAPAASLLLHGAVLAGILLLLHRSPPPQPAEEPAMAMVWEPSQAQDSIANPDAGEPLPAVPAPPEQPAAPPAPPEAAPPPPPPPMAAPAAPPAPPMPAPPVLAELPPMAPMEPLPPALVPTLDALPPPPPPREAVEQPPQPPAVETAAEPDEPPPEDLPLPPPPVPPPPRPAPPRQTAARAAPPPAAPRAAAPQAPEPAVRGGSAQITGVTANASPLYRPPEPRYPDGARQRNETGTVRVRVLLDAAGRVTQVELVSSSGSAELDRLAQSYFAQWRWQPAMHNGQPVAGNVVTGITFRLSP
jgi:protein TonB